MNDVDDAECFEEVRESLDLVGITEEQQRILFRILAAVLHLGNVVIYPGENEDESGIEVRRRYLELPMRFVFKQLGVSLVYLPRMHPLSWSAVT